jgi:hypothetical protein
MPVPVSLRYDRVGIRHDSLFVYRDVYRLATQPVIHEVTAILAAYGVDTTGVDVARVRAVTGNIPRRGAVVPLAGLAPSREGRPR